MGRGEVALVVADDHVLAVRSSTRELAPVCENTVCSISRSRPNAAPSPRPSARPAVLMFITMLTRALTCAAVPAAPMYMREMLRLSRIGSTAL